MKLTGGCAIAKLQSINPGKLSKTELIKAIQAIEDNFDCFATVHDGVSDQVDCLWREYGFEAAK